MAVAQRRETWVTMRQNADVFQISESCLQNWLRLAEIKAGKHPVTTVAESTELRELRRRIQLSEQVNEVLRRAGAYFSQSNLPGKIFPACERVGRGRFLHCGRVSDLVA